MTPTLDLLDRINAHRLDNKRSLLTLNTRLTQLAQDYAEHLAQKKKLVHSNSPTGENLAWHEGQYSGRKVMKMWTLSVSHNTNQLRNWTDIGVGVFTRTEPLSTYYCILFNDAELDSTELKENPTKRKTRYGVNIR